LENIQQLPLDQLLVNVLAITPGLNRWAEPLEVDFLHAMAEDLSRPIPTNRIALFPWPPSTLIDY
jgi:uncharacterized lipoprotein YmbA